MTEILPLPRIGGSRPQATPGQNDQSARAVAQRLEATFLAEMLKPAGLGARSGAFGGGVGEDQFASFHRQALADALVQSGGIGLAETFYRAIMEKRHDGSDPANADQPAR